jgi:membrane protease YdiL (CAAX protease family)
VGIAFLVWIAFQVVAVIGLAAIGYGTADFEDPTDPVLISLLVVSNWIGLLLWPLIASHLKGSGSLKTDYGLSFEPFDLVRGIVTAVAFYGVSVVGTLIYYVLTGSSETPSNSDMVDPAKESLGALVLLFVVVAIGTPIVEELFFRGFLLRAIGKRFGVPIAIVVSSIVFGALHLQAGGWGSLWIVGLLSVYGLILAIAAVRTDGRLGPSIVAHAINNGVTLLYVAGTSGLLLLPG